MANTPWADSQLKQGKAVKCLFSYGDASEMRNKKWKFSINIDGDSYTLSAGPLLRDVLFRALNTTQPEPKTVTSQAGENFTFNAVSYTKGKVLWLERGQDSAGDKGYQNPHFTVTRPGGEAFGSFAGFVGASEAVGEPAQADTPTPTPTPQRGQKPTSSVSTVTAEDFHAAALYTFNECYKAAETFVESKKIKLKDPEVLQLAEHFAVGLRYAGVQLAPAIPEPAPEPTPEPAPEPAPAPVAEEDDGDDLPF